MFLALKGVNTLGTHLHLSAPCLWSLLACPAVLAPAVASQSARVFSEIYGQ